MDACLETGVHYLDTANYEPKDEANLNTLGNGHIKSVLKQKELWLC